MSTSAGFCGILLLLCLQASQAQYPVRLADGPRNNTGRLEIFYAGQWGTVCDDDFSYAEATVFCRLLGFEGDARFFTNAYPTSSGVIWLDDVYCVGTETSIDQCSHDGWGTHNCGHSEDVNLFCGSNFTVRLADGPSQFEGRLEVFYNGVWGTVCDDLFDLADAKVFCRSAGFSGAESFSTNTYPTYTGFIWLDNMECTGYEVTFADCPSNAWGVNDCSHTEDVNLHCTESYSSYAVRLADGPHSASGRLEVNYGGVWGTVCQDGFDSNDADVMCRILGYGGEESYTTGTYYTSVSPIWFSDVECNGYETSFDLCSYTGPSVIGCDHSQDINLSCNESPGSDIVRLVDGPAAHKGRLEVYHDGEWGTVCDDGFDYQEADVFCRSLGYSTGKYGSSSGPIWLDGVDCTGSENSYLQCSHNGWGEHDCSHSEDISLTCYCPDCPSGGLEAWQIALACIGAVIFLIIVVVIIVKCCSKSSRSTNPSTSNTTTTYRHQPKPRQQTNVAFVYNTGTQQANMGYPAATGTAMPPGHGYAPPSATAFPPVNQAYPPAATGLQATTGPPPGHLPPLPQQGASSLPPPLEDNTTADLPPPPSYNTLYSSAAENAVDSTK